jgi:beta-aspartyl-peptidase (threonine type)
MRQTNSQKDKSFSNRQHLRWAIGNRQSFQCIRFFLIFVLLMASMPVVAQKPTGKGGSTMNGPAIKQPVGPNGVTTQPFGFVIHGGAGTLARSRMTPELEKEYRAKLQEALMVGYKILESGGNALDAVEIAIKIMEDSPLFNAGKGAVFTAEGTNELDASIMDGKTKKAGAVAGVKHIKNPIVLARMVMEKSKHVMMAGEGAETFAKQQGMAFVDQNYFFTERRWNDLQRIKKEEKEKEEKNKTDRPTKQLSELSYADLPINRFGTVGAVALDKNGNLAAGTSTGGMTNKKFGRIGDAPVIGAGTYANNNTCAVSATGDGEFFIRTVVAYDISAMMEYQARTLDSAAKIVLDKVKTLGGAGGVIGIDKFGSITMSFNSEGMYRGYIGPDGKTVVKIFRDED